MMVVETKSGSKYAFCTKGKKIYMIHGMQEYLVKEFSLTLKQPLQIRCYALNSLTCEPGEEMFIKTTPVVNIII